MRKLTPYILAFVLMAGCSLTPRETGKAEMFLLTPASVSAQKAPLAPALMVATPGTSAELDTFRIALVRADHRRDYYAGARWPEFLPLVVRDNIAKTLERSKIFAAVSTEETPAGGPYILKTEIRSFEAHYASDGAPPVIRVRFNFTLRSMPGNKLVSYFDTQAQALATRDSFSALQKAFAEAFASAQAKMAQKLANSLQKD